MAHGVRHRRRLRSLTDTPSPRSRTPPFALGPCLYDVLRPVGTTAVDGDRGREAAGAVELPGSFAGHVQVRGGVGEGGYGSHFGSQSSLSNPS
jgi:hypothetical protein